MSVYYTHLSFFFIFFISFICSLATSIFISYSFQSIHLSFNLFSFWSNEMQFSIFIDFFSIWFSTVILLISSIIMVYSYNYMAPYTKVLNFIWLTILFIISMLIVVFFSDLFFVMLGWDGLGLISFFLIVFYQNQSSISSGVFTLMMNRIGDCLFLVSIVLFSYSSEGLFVFSTSFPEESVLLILLLAFMTKSALYPFSPWLPAAMAAPTPISALVHSSTLVTAGLYLMIRFSYFLYSSHSVMLLLLTISIFTSLYAGLNTIFETDLKKLIALSTLSHLGFIGFAFSLGLVHLSFFHMLAHALFKSLLFMCMGDIMINLSHSQDLRFLSSGSIFTPVSCFTMYLSLFNLLGLPFLSGFFSKDLILEMVGYSNISSLLYFFVCVNIFFTYYYTYQLFFYSFSSVKLTPFFLVHSTSIMHSILMFILALLGLVFGTFFLSHIYHLTVFLMVPNALKFLPLLLNMSMFLMLVVFLIQVSSKSKFVYSCGSSMMYLSVVMKSVSSFYFLMGLFDSVKSFESGSLNFLQNISSVKYSANMSLLAFSFAQMNSFKVIFVGVFLILTLSLICI